MLNDPLANVLSSVMSASRAGKNHCTARVSSKLIRDVLTIMRDHRYIGEFSIVEDRRGNPVTVQLIGALNKCCVVKPRFSVKRDEYEKFEKRFLPAKGFGLLIVSTSKGVMTQNEAKEKGLGGKLLAYVY